MTTGTVTYHTTYNYGQFLQAFALQKKVKNNEIINFIPNFLYEVGEDGRKKIPFFWFFVAIYRRLRKQKGCFTEWNILSFTRCFSFFSSVRKHVLKDVLISGSDQIWSVCPILMDYYFLNFGSKVCKRISYAASLGVKQWPKDFEQRVLPLLQRFDAISVREESAVEYLSSLGLKNVVCVCDPTILHKGDFYRKEFGLVESPEKSVFIYKIREKIPDVVESIIQDNSNNSCSLRMVDLQNKKTICSVTQWLTNIDNAKFVVTDSFHCAVFCILFHKPFVVLANHGSGKGMNERFQTLLGKTDLLYRVLPQDPTKEDVLERLNRPIDWEKIDATMEEWRTYSANWLKEKLEE